MKNLRFRRPQLIPLLFILCATALLTGLGVWQMDRLQQKEALLARIHSAQEQPLLAALPENPAQGEYRRAVFSGRFLADKTLRFVGRKTGGYVLLTPFLLDDSDEVVLVSRGWFEKNLTNPQPSGLQTVQGMLRPPLHKRLFSPANRPELNVWFTEDVPAMRAATGLALFPLILDTGTPPPVRNDHLGYALTWFLLAAIGIVMFALYHREPVE